MNDHVLVDKRHVPYGIQLVLNMRHFVSALDEALDVCQVPIQFLPRTLVICMGRGNENTRLTVFAGSNCEPNFSASFASSNSYNPTNALAFLKCPLLQFLLSAMTVSASTRAPMKSPASKKAAERLYITVESSSRMKVFDSQGGRWIAKLAAIV